MSFKSLVTGGCGFIGSHLVDKLINLGHEVVVLDNLSTGRRENLNKKATFIEGDILNYKLVDSIAGDVDFIFHFAALPRIQPSFTDPIEHEKVNVVGSINCIMASMNKGVKKFIFAGSSSCYGNTSETPTSESAQIDCLNPYSLQKYTAEQYCLILGKRYGVSVNSIRIFNPYGPRSFNPENSLNAYSSVVGIFENQAKTTGKLTITGDGSQSRDFIHVYDLVDAVVLAATREISGEIINVGFGESVSINSLAKLFKETTKEYIPPRHGEAKTTLACIDKARKLLDWSPKISLEKGVKLLNVFEKD